MFWTAFFSCLLMVYGLNTWLPKLMIEAGYGLNSSLGFLITLQGGAIVGRILSRAYVINLVLKKCLFLCMPQVQLH